MAMDMASGPDKPAAPSETSRRKFLLVSTTGLGAIGVVATAIPFLESMSPSERARAAGAPTTLDLGTVAPGALVTVEWRGKPIWVLHRTPQMIASLDDHDYLLLDPQSKEPQQPPYARNRFRSIKPEFFVAIAICTHLGCIPSYRPQAGEPGLGANWPGGFYCPCHGSAFDLAGRVFKNVPAPRNLEIPPYVLQGNTLVIGEEGALPTAT